MLAFYCLLKNATQGDVSHRGHFPLVRSGRPKRPGSDQFKWEGPRRARTFFPVTTLQTEFALWPTGAGELSGSDPWAGPFWPKPVLRSRAFHLRTGQTGQMGSNRIFLTTVCIFSHPVLRGDKLFQFVKDSVLSLLQGTDPH